MTQLDLWRHVHDPVVMHMKSGERWRVCRTCGLRLPVKKEQ